MSQIDTSAEGAITRTVLWGEDLMVKSHKSDGGLAAAVTRIRGVVGPQIGVRNSFSKLYDTTNPAKLRHVDKWRAWLLLTAIGEDPADWGISEDVVPSVHADRLDSLRRLMNTRTSDYKTTVSRPHRANPPRRADKRAPHNRGR